MAVRKRNEFLEDGSSEDDFHDDGYNSEEAEEGRGDIAGRLSKRRRVHVHSDEESIHSFTREHEEDGDVDRKCGCHLKDAAISGAERFALGSDFGDGEQLVPEDNVNSASSPAEPTKKRRPKPVAAAEKAVRKSGVIYISRVPPFMKPQTLRHFLAPHASKGTGRIFLTPEEHTMHLQRVKRGGNKKKSFTDGWVEFTSKTEAKLAAETLNGNIIGGKKGNFYHDDMWNIKYLKGFKWAHLTEQIANQNAERAARLREELRRTRQENKAFVEDVERGKMLVGIESKRKAKQKPGAGEVVGDAGKLVKAGRKFEQRKARENDTRGARDQTVEQKRVMSMAF